ncbi:hypothetical protein [Candidatus Macondimonas diazotrophica]|jgi:hypothetical protein|uniref:Uncharacterized protein n=1 Tax=Candidatus Macondimonas diazotrophica TaxID=2305248 RepID=A0A4Z0F678_9GAMM|nr:hypothetical protein [Candidatus Macondimonas diazotrophica]TFZ81680.1 hypothetical protein E4680_11460 [Candidatus Macondimonas diazotrophica]
MICDLELLRELILPNIPNQHTRHITHCEDVLFDFRHLANITTANYAHIAHGQFKYDAIWMHEAWPTFKNPEHFSMYKNPYNDVLFKVRLLHYKELKLAVIRRKWPTIDFIVKQ